MPPAKNDVDLRRNLGRLPLTACFLLGIPRAVTSGRELMSNTITTCHRHCRASSCGSSSLILLRYSSKHVRVNNGQGTPGKACVQRLRRHAIWQMALLDPCSGLVQAEPFRAANKRVSRLWQARFQKCVAPLPRCISIAVAACRIVKRWVGKRAAYTRR